MQLPMQQPRPDYPFCRVMKRAPRPGPAAAIGARQPRLGARPTTALSDKGSWLSERLKKKKKKLLEGRDNETGCLYAWICDSVLMQGL